EAGLALNTVARVRDTAEGVVRGDTVAQVEDAAQPVKLGVTEAFDSDPVVGAAVDGTKSDSDDTEQGMAQAAVYVGLRQGREVAQQCQRLCRPECSPAGLLHPRELVLPQSTHLASLGAIALSLRPRPATETQPGQILVFSQSGPVLRSFHFSQIFSFRLVC